jgi:DNA replication protein DnaC
MNNEELRLTEQLNQLRLTFIAQQYQSLADQAARQQWTPLQYLARLIEGESQRQHDRHIARRLAAARFPLIKTLEQFNWNWPKKINQAQVQNLFRLAFLKDQTSVVFIGGVGLGKSHLATALGHAACLQGHSVLFTTAVEAINTLIAAQAQCRLKAELKKFLAPTLVIVDSCEVVNNVKWRWRSSPLEPVWPVTHFTLLTGLSSFPVASGNECIITFKPVPSSSRTAVPVS